MCAGFNPVSSSRSSKSARGRDLVSGMSLVRRAIDTLVLSYQVLGQFAFVTITDYLPTSMRRRIFSKKLQGPALEKRLSVRVAGGWKMLLSMWRMNSVQLRQTAVIGQQVPVGTLVYPLLEDGGLGAPIDLSSRTPEGFSNRPLVLNFGSCT